MLPVLILASIRPGAAFLAAPLFGAAQVPVMLRFVLALAVGVPAMAVAAPAAPPFGPELFLLVAHEALIGFALGFALQAGFAAALIAGEAIGNAMGLGFATMIDPTLGRATPAFAQALSLVAMLVFLAADGHLAFVAVLIDSYRAAPPGGALTLQGLALTGAAGAAMFGGAVAIALPVVTGVILIQLLMALLARSAPALNLFAVGLPAAVLAGLMLTALAMPVIGAALLRATLSGLDLARSVA